MNLTHYILSFGISWNVFDSKFQYLSVGHPPYYKGLDYIYEDRGEVASLHSLAALMK